MCDCNRDSGLMCVGCRDKIIDDWYQSKNHRGLICRKCSVKEDMLQWIQWTAKPQYLDLERENMETKNLEITVKLNGKEVPLDTISTETFEAIKALEKPKEIPVARIADFYGAEQRLLIAPTASVDLRIGRVYSFDLRTGALVAGWAVKDDDNIVKLTYRGIRPL